MNDLVAAYFAAMQRGPGGHEAVTALFADDAVYAEPFSGRGPHVGRAAIATFLAASAGEAPPGLRLIVERIDVDGDTVVAVWRCESPIFAKPSRGQDRFTIAKGRIARLESSLLEPPELED